MLIDDHSAMGMIFRTMLGAMGQAPADFEFCQDVDEAVTRIENNPPYDVIFLDNIVPPTFEFRGSLEMMKALDKTTNVVLLSAEIPNDFGDETIDSRIAACMEKDALSARSLHELLMSFETPMAS
ncbi:response regulator [Ponticaulis sp.]|uniref:response regulator n=1 Tax=Ponticaulis sp. TaxID=2020902 RepID=UPI0026360D94|nr:response regulator [Ponticaulis sp.]MDF1680339.1 response regulator [Ponticaulis sp.]